MMDKIYQNDYIYELFCKFPIILKKPILRILYKYREKNLKSIKTPKVLTFFVTNRCNAKCNHCFYWKELNTLKKQEMTLEQIKKFVISLKNPLLSVLLTGGEPFLREDLIEISQIFSKYNKTSKVIIPTNGYLSEKIYETVNKILETTKLKVDVIISLDGFEKTAEKTRGLKNIFKKDENTIKLLKKINNSRFNLYILTTVSKKNYGEVLDLIRFNQKNWKIPHKIQYVRSCNEVYNLDPKVMEGFSQKNDDYSLPSFKEIEELNKEMRKITKKNSLSINMNHLERETALEILKSKKKVMKCVAGVYDAVIFPNGNVSMCEFTKPFGNLKNTDYDFFKLWISYSANKMRDKIKECSCIHSCNLIDSIGHDKNKLFKLFNS